jgi:tape measure domain-containing protein
MSNTTVEYLLRLKDQFSTGIRTATNDTEKLNQSVNSTQSSLNSLKTAFAAIGAGVVIRNIVNTTAAMEGLQNQLNFASGSAEQGARDFNYLRETSQAMGLDLLSATEGFVGLAASFKGTSIEGQKVRDVFEGMAMASTVNHMTAQQTAQAFKALSDMAGKGVVSMEELRGQLGDAGLKGAFKIAADAMDMTTMELNKFVADGKLLAEDFIPRFAAQLKKEFAGGMSAAAESLTSRMNLMNNAFLELKLTVGELFLPVIIKSIQLVSSFTNFVRENAVAISFLTGAFVSVAGAIFIYNSYMKIAAIYSGARFVWGLWSLAAALDGVTVAQWLLNTATAFFAGLSGVGMFAVAAAGAAALTTGIMAAKYAYDKLNKSAESGVGATTNALNPMAKGLPKQSPGSANKPQKTSAGTSTTAVESRGVQNFNISIQKLVENIILNTTNLKESSVAIKEEVTKALIEAVNDFQLMATK